MRFVTLLMPRNSDLLPEMLALARYMGYDGAIVTLPSNASRRELSAHVSELKSVAHEVGIAVLPAVLFDETRAEEGSRAQWLDDLRVARILNLRGKEKILREHARREVFHVFLIPVSSLHVLKREVAEVIVSKSKWVLVGLRELIWSESGERVRLLSLLSKRRDVLSRRDLNLLFVAEATHPSELRSPRCLRSLLRQAGYSDDVIARAVSERASRLFTLWKPFIVMRTRGRR